MHDGGTVPGARPNRSALWVPFAHGLVVLALAVNANPHSAQEQRELHSQSPAPGTKSYVQQYGTGFVGVPLLAAVVVLQPLVTDALVTAEGAVWEAIGVVDDLVAAKALLYPPQLVEEKPAEWDVLPGKGRGAVVSAG
ncbi:hypothetical protein [Streptomyces avermitilis]|uniref:hypothetical protein n=1 Tax=Streptomyces avermitilis TaxID=33903 RepID=UPI0033FBCACF